MIYQTTSPSKSSTLSLQAKWTGFDPHLYSSRACWWWPTTV